MTNIKGKHILDATCGSRTMWFDKECPLAVYMDKREEKLEGIWADHEGNLSVNPDVVADFTKIPFPDFSFELVVFDPPHLARVGDSAWMRKKYGCLPNDWQPVIHDGFWECWRVLKEYGTLIFKWSEIQISTRKIIDVIGKEPLFGHRSGKRMNTHWLVYMKMKG